MLTVTQLSATLLSVRLATSAFTMIASNSSSDKVISQETAIDIIKTSTRVDPTKQIVNDDNLQSAELLYTAIHWENYLHMSGYHTRLYVSNSPVGEISPYWFIDYQDTNLTHYSPTGNYIVDARTGELMLSQEDTGGPPSESDFKISYSPRPETGILTLKPGETKALTVTLTALPSYDASLPVNLEASGIPSYVMVRQNATSAILRTGESASFMIWVTAGLGRV